LRVHRKVWLAWGKWWAFQYYRVPCSSLGFHVDLRRPLLDLHVTPLVVAFALVPFGLPWWVACLLHLVPAGVVTLSVGAAPHITGQADRHRQSCRGFLFADDPIL